MPNAQRAAELFEIRIPQAEPDDLAVLLSHVRWPSTFGRQWHDGIDDNHCRNLVAA